MIGSKLYFSKMFGLLVLLLLFTSCVDRTDKEIIDGIFSFPSSSGLYQLTGDILFQDEEFTFEADTPLTIPQSMGIEFTYGTFQFTLKNLDPDLQYGIRPGRIGVASDWYVNGEPIQSLGNVSKVKGEVEPQWNNGVIVIPAGFREAQITVHVSNYINYTSGFVSAVIVGPLELVNTFKLQQIGFEMVVFGALIIMALYHSILALFRRQDKTFLFLALLCWILGIRRLMQGELFIYDMIPTFPWHLQLALGYLTFTVSVGVFMSYVFFLYEDRIYGKEWIPVWIIAGGFSLAVLFFPISIYSRFLNVFQYVTIVFGMYAVFIIGKAVYNRDQGAVSIIIGFLFFFGAVIHDILKSMGTIVSQQDLSSFGMLLFILVQSILLARRFSFALRSAEEYGQNMSLINAALNRFVPNEFLSYLQKTDITTVRLGDHQQMEMTVIFTDIRSFTSLSEQMTPKETFNFINSFLARIGPIIRKHNGFVDKFLGDGIMALFPREPEDALKAAWEMQEELKLYNHHRKKTGYDPIRIGIGIHIGQLMMGTIGEHERMDSTVISDTVNLACRLEEHTKNVDADMLVSKQFIDALREQDMLNIEHKGSVMVKGRSESVSIYTILPPEITNSV
jgi:adenylate cyclase